MNPFSVKQLVAANRHFIISEFRNIQGFLSLLFKERNTGQKWTMEEKREIIRLIKRFSLYIPGLVIFVLPGGRFLLPFLILYLDRRQGRRVKST